MPCRCRARSCCRSRGCRRPASRRCPPPSCARRAARRAPRPRRRPHPPARRPPPRSETRGLRTPPAVRAGSGSSRPRCPGGPDRPTVSGAPPVPRRLRRPAPRRRRAPRLPAACLDPSSRASLERGEAPDTRGLPRRASISGDGRRPPPRFRQRAGGARGRHVRGVTRPRRCGRVSGSRPLPPPRRSGRPPGCSPVRSSPRGTRTRISRPRAAPWGSPRSTGARSWPGR